MGGICRELPPTGAKTDEKYEVTDGFWTKYTRMVMHG